MVILGFTFILVLALFAYLTYRNTLEKNRWLLWTAVFMVPLAYLASVSGWIVAEIGRQPWVIQDLMPTLTAVTKIDTLSVIITFFMFATIFTALLIAELKIMSTQIKKGPQEN
jgi:cytochrome d ubiquinol oxidase subunit I